MLASPYFTTPPADLTDNADAEVAWWQARRAEKDALENALRDAKSEADLSGEPKAIYDRAVQAIIHAMDLADSYARLHGEE